MSDQVSFISIGALGAGFLESSLERGLARGVDFIGADAGSVDGGPFALAGVSTNFPASACSRDLSLLTRAAARAGVPLLIGSCHSSGRNWGVDTFADMVRTTAREHGLRLKVAKIYAEVDPALVVERLHAGRLHAIEPAPPYDEDVIRRSVRIIGVMGVEPFQQAIAAGADVVLAGRASDTSIFAAIPAMRGFDPGICWHAAKIAECGTSAAEPRKRLDCLYLTVDRDGVIVEPLAPELRCTPFSVAAHQLHEVGDPFVHIEPGWVIDMTDARYDAVSDRAVRVSGSTARRAPYTVKLEGVESAGFQRVFMMSVRDPTILGAIDEWMQSLHDDIATRAAELLPPGAFERCATHVRVYGRDGTMGPLEPIKRFEGHEAFLLIDIVAPVPEHAETLASIVWYAFIHAKSPRMRGHGTMAWPFNPPVIDRGEVYRFNVHHAIEVDDPLEVFRIEYEEVG